MIKEGMIGFSNNKKGWLPACIRFFTKSNISHAFIISKNYGDQVSVEEAALLVQIVPFDKYYRNDDTQDYWIYDPVKVTRTQKQQALEYCFKEFAGVKYGKLQLIWFVYRWANEFFLKRDVRKEKNWMADGVICSELQCHYLIQLGGEYAELVKDFNPDTIQAEDLRKLVVSRPDLFQFVEKKVLAEQAVA